MSQKLHSCRGGDDSGKVPKTGSVSSHPLSGKRPRDKENSPNNAHLNGHVNENATGSTGFVVDLELADDVEDPPNKKRRGDVRSERSLEGVEATDKDVGSEDSQVTDHSEPNERIYVAAAASHPLHSDSEQPSRDDGSAKPPSNASGRKGRVTWEDHLSELDDFCAECGHCNVPKS
jgi:hypothetical protein